MRGFNALLQPNPAPPPADVLHHPIAAGTMAALRAATVLCIAVGINAEAVELTEKNFDRLVIKSGKSAFIKFQAPW